MKIKGSFLSWIVVKDLKKSKKFFEEIGLKSGQCAEEFGWLEFSGHEGGASLGIAAESDKSEIPVGSNAVVTFTVENIEEAVKELKKKGVKLLGDIMEVPGHVKLQSFCDPDGNHFQLAELLDE